MNYYINPLTGNVTVHLSKREVQVIWDSLDFMNSDQMDNMDEQNHDLDLMDMADQFEEIDIRVNRHS